MQVTKESIQAVLLRKDEVGMHALGRALLVLYANQTDYEQRVQVTTNRNSQGFTPNDAKKGTGMAQFYQRNGYLSPAQIAYWQEPARTEKKRIRILKYWRQLLEAAQLKQKEKLKAASPQMSLAA